MFDMRNCEEMRSENYAGENSFGRHDKKKLIIGKGLDRLSWRGFSLIHFFIFPFPSKTHKWSSLKFAFLHRCCSSLSFYSAFFIFAFQWKIHQTFFHVFVFFFLTGSFFLLLLLSFFSHSLEPTRFFTLAICRLFDVICSTNRKEVPQSSIIPYPPIPHQHLIILISILFFLSRENFFRTNEIWRVRLGRRGRKMRGMKMKTIDSELELNALLWMMGKIETVQEWEIRCGKLR